MKTVCIKTNNMKVENYLLENLKELNLDDVYFSCRKFKIYNNFFIHYKGQNTELFLSYICNILSSLVLDLFEDNIFKKIISREYFYFDNIEKKQIMDNIQELVLENENDCCDRVDYLFDRFYDFLENNNKLYLKGFMTFRQKKYIGELEKIVDSAVNQYLIEKEYTEFVSLLKLYVNSEGCKSDFVHLIYKENEPILLDSKKNIIKTDINLMNAKYLSDINFSSCDMILNTLLNIIPERIYIHLVNHEVDEFITTLKLIFENRIHICRDCAICAIYKRKAQKINLT